MSDVTISVGTDVSKALSGLTAVGAKMKAIGGAALTALGPIVSIAAAFEALRRATMRGFDLGGKLSDIAANTGFSVDALHRMRFVLEQNGVAAEALTKAIYHMQSGLATGQLEESLTKIGVPFKELQAMSPEQQFRRIGEAIAALPDPSEQVAVARQVFGRSGADLLAAFKSGIEEVPEYIARQAELLAQNAKELDTAGDILKQLGNVFDSFAVSFSAMLASGAANTQQAVSDLGVAAEKLGSFLGAVVRGAGILGKAITLGAMELVNKVAYAGTYLHTLLKESVSSIFAGNLVSVFQSVGYMLKDAGATLASLITGAASKLLDAISFLPGVGDKIGNLAKSVAETARVFEASALEARGQWSSMLQQVFGDAIASAREAAAKSLVFDVTEFADQIASDIINLQDKLSGKKDKQELPTPQVPPRRFLLDEEEEEEPKSPPHRGGEKVGTTRSQEDILRDMAGAKGRVYRSRAARAQRALDLLEQAKEAAMFGDSQKAARLQEFAQRRARGLGMSLEIPELPGAESPALRPSAAADSPMRLVAEIRDILSRIEPKLPTPAMCY